jgi:hypothetical protein
MDKEIFYHGLPCESTSIAINILFVHIEVMKIHERPISKKTGIQDLTGSL